MSDPRTQLQFHIRGAATETRFEFDALFVEYKQDISGVDSSVITPETTRNYTQCASHCVESDTMEAAAAAAVWKVYASHHVALTNPTKTDIQRQPANTTKRALQPRYVAAESNSRSAIGTIRSLDKKQRFATDARLLPSTRTHSACMQGVDD